MDPALQAMMANSRSGAGGGDEFFNKWLCFLLPQLQLDTVPINLETAAPLAFMQRNIFPMMDQISGFGVKGGLWDKIVAALQIRSIQNIPNVDLAEFKNMLGEGAEIGHDASFDGAIIAASAGAAVAAQSAAMIDDGPSIG